MRLPQIRLTWRSLSIPAAIAADLLALWVWATRTPRVYSEWLGLVGRPEDAPIFRLLAWAREEDAPGTPSGLVSLFGAGELFSGGALLLAPLLLVLLAATRRGSRLGVRLTSPVRMPRRISARFRLTTALAAVAAVGLYLGWEIDAWKTWRLQDSYRTAAGIAANQGESTLSSLQQKREALTRREAEAFPPEGLSLGHGHFRTKAALAAERDVGTAWDRREIAQLSALVSAYAARKRKYEWAAAHPHDAVAPNPPLPELGPEPNAVYETGRLLLSRDYARALAAYDELSRAYPDYVEAHSALAWLRATCPDDRYRDGRLAVASATRACELTNWDDVYAWDVLAAALAEAGDYAKAAEWQQKALDAATDASSADLFRGRLALYKAGKPFRQE